METDHNTVTETVTSADGVTAEMAIADTDATPGRNTAGAPKGNRNALKHGTRSFVLGRLPRGASYIGKLQYRCQRDIEREVIARKGEISLYDAAVINSAVSHERTALQLMHYLRKADDPKTISLTVKSEKGSATTTEPKGLGIMERASLLGQVSKARDRRDACLRALGLDKAPGANMWEDYDRGARLIEASYPDHTDQEQEISDDVAHPERTAIDRGTTEIGGAGKGVPQ